MKPAEIKINLKEGYMVMPFEQDLVVVKISNHDFVMNLKNNTIEFKADMCINNDKVLYDVLKKNYQ